MANGQPFFGEHVFGPNVWGQYVWGDGDVEPPPADPDAKSADSDEVFNMPTELITGPVRERELLNAKASATAANSVVTLTANADRGYKLYAVHWSYSAAPTGGRLTVSIGGTVEYDFDITASGPGSKFFTAASGEKNQAILVNLWSGGDGIVGKVTAEYRLLQA